MLLGVAWYYALYSQMPYLLSHKIPAGGDAPDYYLGLYGSELFILMCLTALLTAALWRKRISDSASADWVKWSAILTGSGILAFSWLIVIYAIVIRVIGINRPEQLNLFYPELFAPGSPGALALRYLIFVLVAPLVGAWFSLLAFVVVVPMAFLTQWLMRKVAL